MDKAPKTNEPKAGKASAPKAPLHSEAYTRVHDLTDDSHLKKDQDESLKTAATAKSPEKAKKVQGATASDAKPEADSEDKEQSKERLQHIKDSTLSAIRDLRSTIDTESQSLRKDLSLRSKQLNQEKYRHGAAIVFGVMAIQSITAALIMALALAMPIWSALVLLAVVFALLSLMLFGKPRTKEAK